MGGRAVWGEKWMCWHPDGMTILEVGVQPRTGNTRLRIFIFWVVVEALRVGKALWKSVESEKSKVARAIPGGPIFKSMKKKRS